MKNGEYNWFKHILQKLNNWNFYAEFFISDHMRKVQVFYTVVSKSHKQSYLLIIISCRSENYFLTAQYTRLIWVIKIY